MRAISSFRREAGISTFWCRAWSALRTRVSMSATGSVNLIVCFSSCHPFAPRDTENLRQLYCFDHYYFDCSSLPVSSRRRSPPLWPLLTRLREQTTINNHCIVSSDRQRYAYQED